MKVATVPKGMTIFQALSEKYCLDMAKANLRFVPEVEMMEKTFELHYLAEQVTAAISAYGLRNFSCKENSDYGLISLTYNPDLNVDQHSSTLHTGEISAKDQSYNGINKVKDLRNSYIDTYAFRKQTDACKMLKSLLPKLKRSLVRSRIATIKGNSVEATGESFGWHTDEPVFENLRINIPITSPEGYALEVQAKDGYIDEYRFEVGKCYCWDTGIPHRAYATRVVPEDRTHLVLGFSPWFDYDEETDSWVPNEFFGKKHPFEMFKDGDFIKDQYVPNT